jgi:hypothetical protein
MATNVLYMPSPPKRPGPPGAPPPVVVVVVEFNTTRSPSKPIYTTTGTCLPETKRVMTFLLL